MKRSSVIALGFIVLVGMSLGTPSFAQEMRGMEHKGMMGGKMCGMGPKGCPMMQRQVVATTDGGVVVVMGNKITKYDKSLNVVKEAEIKVDMAAMHKSMMGMMKDCPMMKDSEPVEGEKTADPVSEQK